MFVGLANGHETMAHFFFMFPSCVLHLWESICNKNVECGKLQSTLNLRACISLFGITSCLYSSLPLRVSMWLKWIAFTFSVFKVTFLLIFFFPYLNHEVGFFLRSGGGGVFFLFCFVGWFPPLYFNAVVLSLLRRVWETFEGLESSFSASVMS